MSHVKIYNVKEKVLMCSIFKYMKYRLGGGQIKKNFVICRFSNAGNSLSTIMYKSLTQTLFRE